MTNFDFTALESEQLEKYLQNDPDDITKGIPHVLAYECADVLEIFSSFRWTLSSNQYQIVMQPFVQHIFEKALAAIFNKYISILDDQVIAEGIKAWSTALRDMEAYHSDDIADEERQDIPDWDNGMIACVIIKACGRKLIEKSYAEMV